MAASLTFHLPWGRCERRGGQQAEVVGLRGGRAGVEERGPANSQRVLQSHVAESTDVCPGVRPPSGPLPAPTFPCVSLQTQMWYPWRQRADPTSSSTSRPMGLWSWPSGRAAMPSAIMPPSCCTRGCGGQAWWPWSLWQSLDPSFPCQALCWPCGHTNTQRCSARAHSSSFWVIVYLTISLGSSAPHSASLPALSPLTLQVAPKRQNLHASGTERPHGCRP